MVLPLSLTATAPMRFSAMSRAASRQLVEASRPSTSRVTWRSMLAIGDSRAGRQGEMQAPACDRVHPRHARASCDVSAQVGGLQPRVLGELPSVPLQRDLAPLEHVRLLRGLQRHARILLYQEDGGPLPVDVADDVEDLP